MYPINELVTNLEAAQRRVNSIGAMANFRQLGFHAFGKLNVAFYLNTFVQLFFFFLSIQLDTLLSVVNFLTLATGCANFVV